MKFQKEKMNFDCFEILHTAIIAFPEIYDSSGYEFHLDIGNGKYCSFSNCSRHTRVYIYDKTILDQDFYIIEYENGRKINNEKPCPLMNYVRNVICAMIDSEMLSTFHDFDIYYNKITVCFYDDNELRYDGKNTFLVKKVEPDFSSKKLIDYYASTTNNVIQYIVYEE